jgi:hypothetical protein
MNFSLPNRRPVRGLILLCIAYVLVTSVQPVSGQTVRMTLPQYMIWSTANDLARAVVAVGAYANQKAELSKTVMATREAYWTEYPDGPNLETARQAYSAALIQKDLFNGENLAAQLQLQDMRIGGGLKGELAADFQQKLAAFERLTGGPIEPTHRYAYFEFEAWVQAFVDAKAKGKDNEQAFRDALPKYDEYAAVRDRAEYLFTCPKGPLASSDPKTVVAGVLAMSKYMPADEVERQAAELVAAVEHPEALIAPARKTAEDVRARAHELRDYVTRANTPDPTRRMPPQPAWAGRASAVDLFTWALEREPGRISVLAMIRSETAQPWAWCNEVLTRWETKHGRDRVLATAERVTEAFSDPSTVDDPTRRAAEMPFESLCLELGEPLPLSVEATYWLKAYRKAVAAPLAVQQSFGKLSDVVDKKMLDAVANDNAYSRLVLGKQTADPMVSLANFAHVSNNDAAFLAFVIYDDLVTRDRDVLGAGRNVYDEVAAEYTRLLEKHDRSKLLRATTAVRARFEVIEIRPYGALAPGQVTSMDRLRIRLGEKVEDKEATAKAARLEAIGNESGGPLATALELAADPNKQLANAPGWYVKKLAETRLRMEKYIASGQMMELDIANKEMNLILMTVTSKLETEQRNYAQRKPALTPGQRADWEAKIAAIQRFQAELQRQADAVSAANTSPTRTTR